MPTLFELPLRTCCKQCQNYLKRNVELIRVVDGDNTLVCGLILVVEICTQARALHLARLQNSWGNLYRTLKLSATKLRITLEKNG